MSSPALKEKYAAAHAQPQGAGDARPTARQIVEDEGLLGKLTGRVFLVTGCSSGIGVETARALHATGADVYITVRDVPKGEEVLEDIRKSNAEVSQGKLGLIKMELDSLDSVRAGAADFLSKSKTLNVLVNNAGVMACPESKTKDGIEMQFGVNHLAHFLLFELLKPTLLASASAEFPSRVVSLTSSGHRAYTCKPDDLDWKQTPYQPWLSYGNSKTANIWLALEIERRYGSKHLHANAVMPGGIWTGLQTHVSDDIMNMWKSEAAQKFFKSTQQGAATSVWAAIGAEWANQGGRYLVDCAVAKPNDPTNKFSQGYAPHAYDAEGAKKLWTKSLELVGLKDDQ